MEIVWFLVWLSGVLTAVAFKGLYWTEESHYGQWWHKNDPMYGLATGLICFCLSWVALLLMVGNLAFLRFHRQTSA
jgi:hypothetical protein